MTALSAPPRVAATRSAWPWVLGGAFVLVLPAALNGVPFTYYDSADYIARPDGPIRMLQRMIGMDPPPRLLTPEELAAATPEDMPLSHRGRSIWYRFFGWGGWVAGGLWPVVVLQALAVSAAVMVLWRRVLGWRPDARFVALMAALAAVTPLGYFTGLVMPDALTGPTVLATALLMLAWGRLQGRERAFLVALLTFALLSHATHVLIAAGMVVLALACAWPLSRAEARPSGPGTLLVAAAVAAALLLDVLYAETYNRRAVAPLVTFPHITAGLVDGGPGAAFLQRNCPGAGFVLCDYADRLPMHWIDFLFDETDPDRGVYAPASPARARAIAGEQVDFLRAVLADDPGGMALYVVDQTVRQLVRFGMDDAMIPPGPPFEAIARRLPPELVSRIEASPLHRDPALLDALGTATHAAVLAALAGLVLAARRLRLQPLPAERRPAVAVALALLAGLFLNAMICGTLAAPYDRFQARAIWLLPLAALMLVALSRPAPPPRTRRPAPQQEAPE